MMMKIKCPHCSTDGNFSLAQSDYHGPYRCWKCKTLYTLKIGNDVVQSCEPLSQEEFDRQQEIEAMKSKFKQ